MKKFNKIILDKFCLRQFQSDHSSCIHFDPKLFEEKVNQQYQKAELNDGYAPFCKHIFILNFANCVKSIISITEDNQNLLKSCYEARTEKQLPVLKRYFPKSIIKQNIAKYLDIILYSKQQIQKENQAMNNIDPNKDIDYDYGIISIKAQDQSFETPMDPITMMRNALGKEEGGSGVPLDRKKYLESVEYWNKHALIKS